MLTNAKLVDELASWSRLDRHGNHRWATAWGGTTLRSSEFSATMDSDPTVRDRLQRAEPALHIDPNLESPGATAWVSVPSNVPNCRVELESWLRPYAKIRSPGDLILERPDLNQRIEALTVQLPISPSGVVGIALWADAYRRGVDTPESRRDVHSLADPTGGARLLFEPLVESPGGLQLGYLVARSLGWLVPAPSGAVYTYPLPEPSFLGPWRADRRFRQAVGGADFLDEFAEPLAASSNNLTLSVPVFAHAMRRFEEVLRATDTQARNLAFGKLAIGLAQVSSMQGELGGDSLLPSPDDSDSFRAFAEATERWSTALGIADELSAELRKVTKDAVPALGEVDSLPRSAAGDYSPLPPAAAADSVSDGPPARRARGR